MCTDVFVSKTKLWSNDLVLRQECASFVVVVVIIIIIIIIKNVR